MRFFFNNSHYPTECFQPFPALQKEEKGKGSSSSSKLTERRRKERGRTERPTLCSNGNITTPKPSKPSNGSGGSSTSSTGLHRTTNSSSSSTSTQDCLGGRVGMYEGLPALHKG